ncbi:MAG: hypothetical protein ACR2HH_06770 [Chthoniobacterales bacterium]
MSSSANKIYRVLFALLTAAILVIGFYFPLIELGYAMDSSADVQSRAEGMSLFLPGVAGLVLLVGMLSSVAVALYSG